MVGLFFEYWEWFVRPVFEVLPAITIAQAVGLSLFIGLFRADVSTKKNDDTEPWVRFVMLFATPLSMLFFGWIVNYFIN